MPRLKKLEKKVKMLATMVGRRWKKNKWLKRPKAVPSKNKFESKYKWFKISYLEYKLFLISGFLAESLKANKN